MLSPMTPHDSRPLTSIAPIGPAIAALAMATVLVMSTAALAQETAAPQAPGRKRVSPPQPQQAQGLDYLAGAWRMTWTGRESAVSNGPRSGMVRFTVKPGSDTLDIRVEGQSEAGEPFRESGTAQWDATKKVLTITERLASGVEIRSIGDWSSPIAIRAESAPVKAGTETLKVRRLYSILSAESFMVTEEISVNDGPYQRLGNGRYQKVP